MTDTEETEHKSLGLPSLIATGVGLVVASSCLMSLGQGAGAIGTLFIITMVIACIFNIFTVLCIAELNAVMPNLTGGLAQYTMACLGPFASLVLIVGGYIVSNITADSVEAAMFGNSILTAFPDLPVPPVVFSVALIVILIVVNLLGIDIFAKVQDVVAYGLIISLVVMGFIGIFGLGTGEVVEQPAAVSTNLADIMSLLGLGFFLFVGAEYIIPVSRYAKNPRKQVPIALIGSLVLILVMQIIVVLGMANYTPWGDLAESNSPHMLFGSALLGPVGVYWMVIVSCFAVISTVNTILSSLSRVIAGMAKIQLMPQIFNKKNKRGAYWFGILLPGAAMIIINISGLTSSDQLTFLLLVGCVFAMLSYATSCINVLILRHRLPHAPRTYKVPGGPAIPILGIIGNVYMLFNISPDPAQQMMIYTVAGIIVAIVAVYAFFWLKVKLKINLFKSIPVPRVMAMENDMYIPYHKKWREQHPDYRPAK